MVGHAPEAGARAGAIGGGGDLPQLDAGLIPGDDGAPAGDPELVARLKAWRLETARAAAIPPYVILWDATLLAIAATLPRDEDELLAIKGVGRSKAAKYGPEILAICRGEGASRT